MWNGVEEIAKVPRYDYDSANRPIEVGSMFIHIPCAVAVHHPIYVDFSMYVLGVMEMLNDYEAGYKWMYRHTCNHCGAKFIFGIFEGDKD